MFLYEMTSFFKEMNHFGYDIVELFILKQDLNLNGDSIIVFDIEVLIKPQSQSSFFMLQMEVTENLIHNLFYWIYANYIPEFI